MTLNSTVIPRTLTDAQVLAIVEGEPALALQEAVGIGEAAETNTTLHVSGATFAVIRLEDKDGGVDLKKVDLNMNVGAFSIQTRNDNGTGKADVLSFAHSTGVGTFIQIPVAPASNPTTDNQLARKLYIDQRAVQVAADATSELAAANTERTFTDVAFAVKKSFTVNVAGTVRVRWEQQNDTSATNIQGKVQLNSVDSGATQTTVGAYETKTVDVSGVKPGDTIDILMICNGATPQGKIKNASLRAVFATVVTD